MKNPETIMIETENGPVLINKDDFDPETQTEYSPTKAEVKQETLQATKQAAAATQPPVPAPSAVNDPVKPMMVSMEGKKAFVVYSDGMKVEDNDKIDPKGYANEGAAWDAVLKAGQTS